MKRMLLALALSALSFAAWAEYSFKVTNNTANKIVAIHVSDDGKNWGNFDIGSGIAVGETAKLVWAASTDDGACEWTFRATFEDGSASEDVDFDFCQDDLEVVFE